MKKKVLAWYEKFKTKFLLTENSHFLLNNLTLHVSDPVIQKEYDQTRSMRFDSLFRYAFTLSIAFLIYRTYQVVVQKTEILRIIYAGQITLFCVFWFLFKGRFKMFAPNLVYVYMVMQCFTCILSVYDKVPEFMLNQDRSTDDNKILITAIACQAFNYTSYRTTILLFGPITMLSEYIVLLRQRQLRYHPYSLEP